MLGKPNKRLKPSRMIFRMLILVKGLGVNYAARDGLVCSLGLKIAILVTSATEILGIRGRKLSQRVQGSGQWTVDSGQ